jgi:hypothetical protein
MPSVLILGLCSDFQLQKLYSVALDDNKIVSYEEEIVEEEEVMSYIRPLLRFWRLNRNTKMSVIIADMWSRFELSASQTEFYSITNSTSCVNQLCRYNNERAHDTHGFSLHFVKSGRKRFEINVKYNTLTRSRAKLPIFVISLIP